MTLSTIVGFQRALHLKLIKNVNYTNKNLIRKLKQKVYKIKYLHSALEREEKEINVGSFIGREASQTTQRSTNRQTPDLPRNLIYTNVFLNLFSEGASLPSV